MRTVAVTVLLLLPLSGQDRDDLRDRVELKSGEVLRGRVVQRFEPDEIELDLGGRRKSVPRKDVTGMRTVDDALAQLLDVRRPGLAVAADWALSDMAASLELPAMARLQAYHVLLRDPDHAAAHALLGHVQAAGKWRWRWRGELVPAAAIERLTVGKDFALASEHFVLESRDGLRLAVDTLFDLERTYTAFWRELGEDLHPQSWFPPIQVQVHGSLKDMPKLSTTVGAPYCDPTVRGECTVVTYREATMPRPARLVGLAIEALLYRTLLAPRAVLPTSLDERYAPWLEVGLGYYYESRTTGDPGHVAFGNVALDSGMAGLVLRYRPYGLENFVHVRFLAFHEDARVAPHHVAHAAMLVTWLLDEHAVAGTPAVALRPRFLSYVRLALHEGKGNSSSLLDSALGKEVGRVEDLEAPWIEWLEKASGQRKVRSKLSLPRRSLRDIVVPGIIR